MRSISATQTHASHTNESVLRVATYNIHKGVRGFGLSKRLEIHNLVLGIEALDADIIFLQEVRSHHRGDAKRFQRTHLGWPDAQQAEHLAPEGYHVAYRTNAITRHGEHGNALLSRWNVGDITHFDVSDHRFEQRGLLHVPVLWSNTTVHAIVVHLGLIHSSRVRQIERLAHVIRNHIPAHAPVVVAGDFNDWREKLDPALRALVLVRAQAHNTPHARTFPSRWPLFSLDRFYTRGFECSKSLSPKGKIWTRMSDHLPLLVELYPSPLKAQIG